MYHKYKNHHLSNFHSIRSNLNIPKAPMAFNRRIEFLIMRFEGGSGALDK